MKKEISKLEIKGNFLRGWIPLLVLDVIQGSPDGMHGYVIVTELTRRSSGYFDIAQASIYPILHKLVDQGLLNLFIDSSERGPVRKVYSITELGKEKYAQLRKEYLTNTVRALAMIGETPESLLANLQ